jgi:cold-inducible RNA-binding protein
MSKLFVGGLAWETREEGLQKSFEQFGEIESVRVVTDRATGRSRGFGFVTFVQKEDAQNAIDQMNGTELDGRTIRCDFAQEGSSEGGNRNRSGPYERRGFRGSRGGRGGGRYSRGNGGRRHDDRYEDRYGDRD